MQPPKPPPVILAAITPGTATASATSVSISGVADLEQVAHRGVARGKQAADRRQVTGPQRGFGGEDPRILADDVFRAAELHRVEARAAAPEHVGIDVA